MNTMHRLSKSISDWSEGGEAQRKVELRRLLGKQIRNARLNEGLSLHELAELTSLDVEFLVAVESGLVSLEEESPNLDRINQRLGITRKKNHLVLESIDTRLTTPIRTNTQYSA